MMRPHPAMDALATDGTAAVVGLVCIVLAVVIGLFLDARAAPHASSAFAAHADDEDDSALWTFP